MYSSKKRNLMTTSLSSNKPITQIALEGEFTYSQPEESMESRSTSVLPSIAITKASPSRRRQSINSEHHCEGVAKTECNSQSNISSMIPSSSSGDNEKKREDERVVLTGERMQLTCEAQLGKKATVLSSLKKSSQRNKESSRHPKTCSVRNELSKRLSWRKDTLLTDESPPKTMYFCQDIRSCVRGIVIPRLTDNFGDVDLEKAYQKYSHRQRQKSLVILNIIDIALKLAFYFSLVIRTKEVNGRLRVPISELLLLIPWVVINCVTIGLITCWKKCANHYLHFAALFTWIVFELQSVLVFNSLTSSSLPLNAVEAGEDLVFILLGVYSSCSCTLHPTQLVQFHDNSLSCLISSQHLLHQQFGTRCSSLSRSTR